VAKNREKRHRISRKAVEERREQVLELRLAGLSPANIAQELGKSDVFKHTTVDTVWNDLNALRKRAELEWVEPGPIIKEAYQNSRDSTALLAKAAHRRFKQIGDQIAQTQERIARVDEDLESPEPHKDREELISRRHALIELASQLRGEARKETRLIISINQTQTGMPGKLGLVLRRKEVGPDDGDTSNEWLKDVIDNEPDRDKKFELLRAMKLLANSSRQVAPAGRMN